MSVAIINLILLLLLLTSLDILQEKIMKSHRKMGKQKLHLK